MNKHLSYIQQAFDIRERSAHETHKVGAVVVGDGFEVARPNFYPYPLERTIGHKQKLGNASTTVHAEIAALLDAPEKTDGATIYITQRPCPNCAKAIIEAGIKEVYVSAETRGTALGEKMQPFFEHASLPFLTQAGVGVFEVGDTLVSLNSPLSCTDQGLTPRRFDGDFEGAVSEFTAPFAACIARDASGADYILSAQAKVPNCLSQERAHEISDAQKKYETALQPLNRLLMACARHGLRVDERSVYSSQTPTAREFVNFIGAGFSRLRIGDEAKCRDKWGLKALEQLKSHEIIDLQFF